VAYFGTKISIGSEFQAANLEELQTQGITAIFNAPGCYTNAYHQKNPTSTPLAVSCNFLALRPNFQLASISDNVLVSNSNIQIEYLEGNLDDDPTCDLQLETLCEMIDDHIKRCLHQGIQPHILVHCRAGKSRSGAVVLAFLIRNYHCSYQEAVDWFCTNRSIAIEKWGVDNAVTPNYGFLKQLENYAIKENLKR